MGIPPATGQQYRISAWENWVPKWVPRLSINELSMLNSHSQQLKSMWYVKIQYAVLEFQYAKHTIQDFLVYVE